MYYYSCIVTDININLVCQFCGPLFVMYIMTKKMFSAASHTPKVPEICKVLTHDQGLFCGKIGSQN